jgi:hypothetical protein
VLHRPHVAAIQRSTCTASSPPFMHMFVAPTLHHMHSRPPHHCLVVVHSRRAATVAHTQNCYCHHVPRGERGKGGSRGHSVHPSHRLHQPVATKRDRRINPHRIQRGDGGRESHRGLAAFHTAHTRSTRHTTFVIQLPPSVTVELTNCCNQRGR